MRFKWKLVYALGFLYAAISSGIYFAIKKIFRVDTVRFSSTLKVNFTTKWEKTIKKSYRFHPKYFAAYTKTLTGISQVSTKERIEIIGCKKCFIRTGEYRLWSRLSRETELILIPYSGCLHTGTRHHKLAVEVLECRTSIFSQNPV